MSFVIAGLLMLSGLVASALVLNAPLLIAARLARKRLHPLAPKLALSLGFALATAYRLWEMERFDVWRHGVPPIWFMLRAYLPWIVALAVAGWFVGRLVVRERRTRGMNRTPI